MTNDYFVRKDINKIVSNLIESLLHINNLLKSWGLKKELKVILNSHRDTLESELLVLENVLD